MISADSPLYVATFHADPTELDGPYCPWEKRAPNTILSTPAHWSAGLSPIFSLNTTVETVMKGKHLLTNRIYQFNGPYLQHVISTFSIARGEAINRSLTDIGGGYNLRGVDFPQHSTRPSQLTVLCFPPKGLIRSQINHPTITNWTKEVNNP
jgi:hypothetical protein